MTRKNHPHGKDLQEYLPFLHNLQVGNFRCCDDKLCKRLLDCVSISPQVNGMKKNIINDK